MLQSEPGDGENLSLPSEENCDAPSEQTPQPKRVRLPWQFWVWQCVPLMLMFLLMPPGNDYSWWFHFPAIVWVEQQHWWGLLAWLIFTNWFGQSILLTFWMVWGTGHWAHRLGRAMGLASTVVLLPAIWFLRHFQSYFSSPAPWSEALDLVYLPNFLFLAFGVSLLPAALVCGTLYKARFRLQQMEAPNSSLRDWQFSLKGLLLLTLLCSLLLAFFNWGLPNMVDFLSMPSIAFYFMEMELLFGRIAIALGSAMAALLAAIILYWQNWRVITGILSFLVLIWFMAVVVETFFPGSVSSNQFLITLHLAGALTLGSLVSLTISRYWIGWHRFKLIRLSKQTSPQEA